MSHFDYTGNKTREISFPLGGIGTGCIGLAGNGQLVDWEIYNRPNKGSVNGFSHFAIKAERNGSVVDARVLHGDFHPPYNGALTAPAFTTFGFGPRREYLTGLPHFRETAFRGEFPLAEIQFLDAAFPGQVRLKAFNPFIPLNERDSGIPAAFFEIEVTNTSAQELDYTLVGALSNPLPSNNFNHYTQAGGNHILYLESSDLAADEIDYGNLALATDAPNVTYQRYWFRGMWFDNLEVYWREFTSPGGLKDRGYELKSAGANHTGMLAAHFHLAVGETRSIRFLMSWYFPNVTNYWNKKAQDPAGTSQIPATWKNYYASIWEDAVGVACYSLREWNRLEAETRLFKETLFASTLPDPALEAVSANLAVLKSPTVMRLEDGTFYGFEGCHPAEGCCEGSCTHVWNYAQALPFLFPKLERSMREADFKYNLLPDGGMPFRLQLPIGSPRSTFRPCADGQFGGVMKSYRDWKICGDTEWLRGLWPAIQKSIEFAWAETNEDRWDPGRLGVLTGRQHHTLDMELFGPNAWLSGFYLGALKAGAEMAEALGENAAAQTFRELFEKGKAWADANLFNGAYYQQVIDLKDRALIESFSQGGVTLTGSTLNAYWNDEHQEIKYQIGEGCEIDQVLAQWHANLYGLGDLFDPRQVKTALTAVFKNNFKQPMRDYYNPCRIYCLNDEGGLVIATWPEGKYKPVIPLPYSQETQNGYEYAAAIQMIQSGLVDEGMTAVAAIRNRYDGEKRNPWNEIECGSNYARSMASYSLLNAFSGFEFNMVTGMVGFDPKAAPAGEFRCFWSLACGWGEVAIQSGQLEIRVLSGHLELSILGLPLKMGERAVAITLADTGLDFEQNGNTIRFARKARIGAGSVLRCQWSKA